MQSTAHGSPLSLANRLKGHGNLRGPVVVIILGETDLGLRVGHQLAQGPLDDLQVERLLGLVGI